jgi:hypothetical protein
MLAEAVEWRGTRSAKAAYRFFDFSFIAARRMDTDAFEEITGR